MSKADAFFESIRIENVKTLHWSLRHGGYSAIKPYEPETQQPPIHLAIIHRKLKSLKCILETIDRMRAQGEVVDYKERETGMTPLMVAANLGWKEGCWELLRNDASLTAVDDKGRTAIVIAKEMKRKAVTLLFDEWTAEESGEVKETTAMRLKREEMAHTKAVKAEAAALEEAANVEAKFQKFEIADAIEAKQKSAATSAAWDEVKVALAETATEIRIERQDKPGPAGVDPALWQCATLKILRLRMQKDLLTSLPSELGQLINLTELIVSHNSLATLPVEIGTLVNLKFLEAEANCLTVLPDELSNCLAMEVVNVTGNQLTSLAPLSGMGEMKSILASGNKLTALDCAVEGMQHLRVLSISQNEITELPAGVGALPQLTNFIASENKLTDLPYEMSNLSEKKVVELQLGGQKYKDRKINQLIEKSVKLVKELSNYLEKRGPAGGGGGGGGGGKKKKKKK